MVWRKLCLFGSIEVLTGLPVWTTVQQSAGFTDSTSADDPVQNTVHSTGFTEVLLLVLKVKFHPVIVFSLKVFLSSHFLVTNLSHVAKLKNIPVCHSFFGVGSLLCTVLRLNQPAESLCRVDKPSQVSCVCKPCTAEPHPSSIPLIG